MSYTPKYDAKIEFTEYWEKQQEYSKQTISLYARGAKGNRGQTCRQAVLQARPTGRKRVDHRSFCDEVEYATTFTGAEVEAVLHHFLK